MQKQSLTKKLIEKFKKRKSKKPNMTPDLSTLAERNEWKILYWMMATICMPIALPLIVFNLMKRARENKYRNCLPGKVVVITGASSGLGEALAHVFYRAGCKVVLAARRQDELERVRKALLNSESNDVTYPPVVMPLDLSELNTLQGVVDKILKIHSKIDILINNGGISVRSDVMSSAIDVDVKVMLVNYFGAVALTKAVLPSMVKRKEGHIVFVSSVQGKFALPYRSSYSASKHALQAFSDSLRAEVAHKGLQVTTVSPGYIRTKLSMNALTGTGQSYGKMDDTTATGTCPDKMAKDILVALLREEKDVILSQIPGILAYYVRVLCPPVYFWIMEKRGRKLEAANKSN
ncbi:dehydrogenase/reductase SDR family protein 7-like isoform X1 [Episyrphus balteatus]|uniref:dehydrogenase/reductase SDR family protein 7-like isoform X1 n=2 Tax=Episyrphus balteatus TaxID=286459 RepID=UPI00248659EA|nr:dehydrogenase/reductase SDR family protein 7-like isoform X1 [Episyrphus balteatus]